ncbi:MAG: hypothetical protein ACJ76J_29770 [Thermoanaerobaculia bacterium]
MQPGPTPTTQTITVNYNAPNITTSPTTIAAQNGSRVTVVWATGSTISAINNITSLVPNSSSALNVSPTLNNGIWSGQYVMSAVNYLYTLSIITDGNTIVQDPQIINDPTG